MMAEVKNEKEEVGTGSSNYELRGVSSQKPEVHQAISKLDKGIFPTAFCKIITDIFAGDNDYCVISHNDGVGTKLALAYAYWKETGDLSVWKGVAIDAIVMNLDDMVCAGVTSEKIVYGMTISRNKRLIPGEVLSAIIEGTQEFFEMMALYGINITYGGGETADVGNLVRTINVDGNMTVRMMRQNVIIPNIQEDDAIIGLSSFGQCVYENEYNAGIRSNGLTSAIHDMLNASVGEKYPETFDSGGNLEKIYCGGHSLIDSISVPDGFMAAGKLLLSPTRTFAPAIAKIREIVAPGNIHAIIHNSGGGQTKVRRFIPEHLMAVKNGQFSTPEVFRILQASSGSSMKEMYEVFNMGVGLEIYSHHSQVRDILAVAKSLGIDAKVIGSVVTKHSSDPAILISHEGKTVEYF